MLVHERCARVGLAGDPVELAQQYLMSIRRAFMSNPRLRIALVDSDATRRMSIEKTLAIWDTTALCLSTPSRC